MIKKYDGCVGILHEYLPCVTAAQKKPPKKTPNFTVLYKNAKEKRYNEKNF